MITRIRLCVLCLPCKFSRLVTKEHFGHAHAPLLLVKVYEHSSMCFVSSLYVRPSWDEGAFRGCPCTSPPYKGVRAFVFVYSSPSLYVRPSCEEGVLGHAPTHVLFIKAYKHLRMCLLPFLVSFVFILCACLSLCSRVVSLKARRVVVNESH